MKLRKGNDKSFLRKLDGDFKFVRIMEIFDLQRFELEKESTVYALLL